MDSKKYGPWAVITGGSEGVGAAFAQKLAASGVNLVLIARKPDALAETAEAARAKGVSVRTLELDLTKPGMLEAVRKATDDVEVGMLICNAGGGCGVGYYHELAYEEAAKQIALNVTGPAELAYHFGRGMRERKRGGMIFLGSNAYLAGAPFIAVYSAAKAFSALLAEGLWGEMKSFNVDVLGLILGVTATPALVRSGAKLDVPGYEAADPDAVAQEGLDHLGKGPIWHAGGTGAMAQHLRTLDRAEAVSLMGKGASLNFE
jgi:short-subunit dehydrogenase